MAEVLKKSICCNCGAVNVVSIDDSLEDNWLPCVAPTGFEWALPSGKITPVVGDPIYVDAVGAHFSREEYLAKYNIDPEIAYTRMRAQRGVHVGK